MDAPWWVSGPRHQQRANRRGTVVGHDQTFVHDASQRLDNRLFANITNSTGHSLREIAEFARSEAARATEAYEEREREYEGRLLAAEEDYLALAGEVSELRRGHRLGRGAVVIALIIGLGGGLWVGASWFRHSPATGASSTALGGTPHTPTTASPRIPADLYSPMPCAPGTWVTFLAAIGGPNSDQWAARMVPLEQNRASHLDTPISIDVHATKFSDLCSLADV